MKRETILKAILLVIIGIMLLAKPINVFADSTNLNDFWEDQGGLDDIGGGTTTETPTDTTQTPDTSTTTPSTDTTTTPSTETKDELPKAGLVEDTMMVVATFGLVAMAIFAYKKTSEYEGI